MTALLRTSACGWLPVVLGWQGLGGTRCWAEQGGHRQRACQRRTAGLSPQGASLMGPGSRGAVVTPPALASPPQPGTAFCSDLNSSESSHDSHEHRDTEAGQEPAPLLSWSACCVPLCHESAFTGLLGHSSPGIGPFDTILTLLPSCICVLLSSHFTDKETGLRQSTPHQRLCWAVQGSSSSIQPRVLHKQLK